MVLFSRLIVVLQRNDDIACLLSRSRYGSPHAPVYAERFNGKNYHEVRSIVKCSKRHKESVRDIGKMVESLGDVRKYLTFIHAFGGCDTTSATFCLSKMSILKLIDKRNVARKAADVFLSRSSSPEAVGEAGSKLFVMLYSVKHSYTLSSLRYSKYMTMASGSTSVKPESLPPSERAAYFHALCVYLQVQERNTARKQPKPRRLGLET